MKLSKETLTIFKNFASINSNITLKPGRMINTISAGKNIIAEAVVSEEFQSEFGIYDLNEFLGVLSLFSDPDLTFSEKYVTIKENKNSVKYFAASSNILAVVPVIKAFPDADIKFDLTSATLTQIHRVASILKVEDFSLIGDGSTIIAQVGNKTSSTGNTFDTEVGVTDKKFRVNFKVENIKVLPGDYTVSIGAKKISRFQAVNQELVYFIAIELDSTFDF